MYPLSDHPGAASGPISLSLAGHQLSLLPAAGYDVGFTAPADSLGFAFDAQTGRHAVGSDRVGPFFSACRTRWRSRRTAATSAPPRRQAGSILSSAAPRSR
ncbi:hypothetical protein QW131_01145 [Roseibium salinum]|nr:hypothetical protein [Roseibium salinum]